MKARLYSFHSSWKLAAAPNKVWQTVTATPFSWESWWPELTDLHVIKTDPAYVGTAFACTWRAKSGYKLHATFIITAADAPHSISFRSEGDLVGVSTWTFSEQHGATDIAISWEAHTTKAWMNFFGPLLKPLFISNHDAIMASGQRGLNAYLTDNSSSRS